MKQQGVKTNLFEVSAGLALCPNLSDPLLEEPDGLYSHFVVRTLTPGQEAALGKPRTERGRTGLLLYSLFVI